MEESNTAEVKGAKSATVGECIKYIKEIHVTENPPEGERLSPRSIVDTVGRLNREIESGKVWKNKIAHFDISRWTNTG